MGLVGIENIIPYKDTYEFKVYKHSDRIDMCDKDLFVCDLKVIISRIDSIYEGKIEDTINVLALVKNYKDISPQIIDELKEFIFNEVYDDKMQKENIEVLLIRS